MKKSLVLLLSLCLAALLCACGEKEEPAAPAPAAAQTQTQEEEKPEAPSAEEAKAEEAAPVEKAEEQAPAGEAAAPTLLETALRFVDKDASELVAAIGEPLEKSYEESCSGPGDDGIWTYDGLTVFTYTENGAETIVDAE